MLVVAAGLLAYHNSFSGPFIYDDVASIRENPSIRNLWPIWQPLSPPHRAWLTVEGRPLVNLSLAINYALDGYHLWGYHALNLAIHILAALTLFGIMRRTLLQPKLRLRFGAMANELALAVALLWTVHPLQTESVTYIVQRAESLMGLFYLLTLYCFIRAAESPRPRAWYGLCVTACALGMASKEVMASAPLLVILYDRAFLSGSLREAWRRRWSLYLALAGTWILRGYLFFFTGSFSGAVTLVKSESTTWWEYLLTEPGVILHYLHLSVWPDPLCFDYYGWPIARTWISVLPPALVLAILLAATLWACKIDSPWGFLGAWFFLILAPSSSFIPLDSPAYEHRMYLSLAAVIVLGVMAIHALVGQRTVAGVVALVIGLGFLTARRNEDYRSGLAIWSDTVAKRPDNARAHGNLGNALAAAGRMPEAIAQFEQALELKPDYAEAHNNRGAALALAGRVGEAIEHCRLAVRIRPVYPEAHYNLGNALIQAGRAEEAIGQFEQAWELKPDYAEAHLNCGNALTYVGRPSEAITQYEQALRIKPDYARAHYNLGIVLAQLGRLQEAMGHYQQALRIKPDYAEAQLALARLRAGQ